MHRLRRVLLTLCVVGAAAVIGACGSDSDDDSSSGSGSADKGGQVANVPFESIETGLPENVAKPERADFTIGWLSPLNANENINVLGKALDHYVKELGGRLILLDGAGDPDKQVSQFQQLLAQKVDGIVVFPLDVRALRPLLEQAEQAGIPVVGAEVDLEETGRLPGYATQIWQRRDRLMYEQSKAMAARLPKGSEVAVIGSALPVPTLEYAAERAKYWAQQFGLEVVGRGDNPTDDIAGGDKAMTEILSKYPDVDGVLAYNEDSAVGAAGTARAQGKRDIVIMGVNGGSLGYDAVRDGRIAATVQIQTPALAQRMIWAAYDAIQGKRLPPVILTDAPKLIDENTVDKVPTWEEQIAGP